MNNENKLRGLKKHAREINKVVVDSLKEALIILLKTKPYDKITIMELCFKAGVSRMAFYGNFTSKDDILTRIVVDMNDLLVERVGSPFRKNTDESWFLETFKLAEEFSDTLYCLLDLGFQNEYLNLVNKQVLHDEEISNDKKYQRIIWAGGLLNCIIYWLKAGMKPSKEDMAKFCNDNLVSWNKMV